MNRPVEQDIPDDILALIARLERKRIWRESWQEQIEIAEQRLDAEKEKFE
jgi:hypothetical protein